MRRFALSSLTFFVGLVAALAAAESTGGLAPADLFEPHIGTTG